MINGRALTEALYPVISERNVDLESEETQKKFLTVLKESNIRNISYEGVFINIVEDTKDIVEKSKKVIEYFLNQLKVDPNSQIGTNDTALHMACGLKTPSKKIIKLLIDHEANPNIYNNKKETPLIIAFENHKIQPDSLELILDTSLENDPQGESLKLVLKNTIEAYIASQQGPELKFSPGPSPDYDFSEPPRPIYRKTEYLEKLKDNILLLCRHLKDNLDINAEYSQGKTLLHIAAETQDFRFLGGVLSHKDIDVNKIDALGQTALHILANEKNDNVELVKLLLNQGINQSILDKHGHTALYYADKSENVDIYNLLSPQKKSARNTGDKDEDQEISFNELAEQQNPLIEYNNKEPMSAKDKNSSSNAPTISKKDLEEFSKDKSSFIEKYYPNESKDTIYSLLLNTAIVLKNKEIIKDIFDIPHSENILTQVDELNCSPISRALYSGDKEILKLVKSFIDKKSFQKVTFLEEDFNNILTVLEFSQFEDLDVEKCVKDYLEPLYTDESIIRIKKVLLEEGDSQEVSEHLSFNSIDEDKFLFDEADFQESSSSIYVSGNHHTSADY